MLKRIILLLVLFAVGVTVWYFAFDGRTKSTSPTTDTMPQTVSTNPDSDNKDSDNDGLTDWYERNVYRTDVNTIDTDGDGRSDREEIQAGVSPTSKQNERLP